MPRVASSRVRETMDDPYLRAENMKRWESERRLPEENPDLIAAGYGVPIARITQAIEVSLRRRKRQQVLRREGVDDVKRRQFLGTAAAAAGALAIPNTTAARQGIDAALSSADTGDITYLTGAVERYRGGYHGRPPAAVLTEMQVDLNVLRDALGQPHRAADRTELVRTTAALAGLVAVVHHDRGDQREASGWFGTAARAAAESGDRRMTAWILARHAMLPLNYGAPHVASALATRARVVAGHGASAAAALAAAVSARALAGTGDCEGALRAIRDAQALADRLGPEDSADTWFGYPRQKHHVHLSQAYTLLGRTADAYAEQQEALALTKSPSVMTRALLALDEAACRRHDGDHQGAADLALLVWSSLPAVHRDGLIRSRSEGLQRSLTGPAQRRLAEALAV